MAPFSIIYWPLFGLLYTTDRVGIKSTIRTSTSNAGHYGVNEDALQRSRIYPVSMTVGIVYRFKNKGYKTPSPRVVTEYVERAADTVYMQPDISKYMPDTVFVEKIVKEKEIVFAGSVIRFELNSSKLSLMSRVNLSYIAKAIKAMPGKVFNVVGHCDVHTGSVAWNEALSQRRSKSVYDALINEFGVDPEQLTMSHKGGVENMFYDEKTLSRVVIIESL